VTFTNREMGTHAVSGDLIGNVAAITHVTVTNDPAFSP